MKSTKQIKSNQYKCDSCGDVFVKGWTDEEALQETQAIFGEVPEEERVVICDDCWHRRTPKEIWNMGEEYKKWKERI